MADPGVGAGVGPYRLVALLGEGAMGRVWRATGEAGEAAVKTLRTAAPRDARDALERELRTLARLSHPGVPAVLGHDLGGPVPWIAMELVEGASLHDHLRRGPGGRLSSAERLRVVGRIARVLAFVHGEGIVHRDLKPANVQLRPDGHPVLLDFGLGLARGSREVLGSVLSAGTPSYMAPEQIRGLAVDARADLYALGCILYEVLAGRPPFVGPIRAILDGHLRAAPPPLDASVSGELTALVRRLLAKDPVDRSGYADEVADALGVPVEGPAPRTKLLRARTWGRAATLAALRDGTGVRWVLGEAGAGKTRVAWELVRATKTEGGAAVLTGSGTDALPALVRGLVELGASVPALARAVDGHRAVLAAVLPALGEAAPPLAPESERTRLVTALCEVLDAASVATAVLVVLDDPRVADGAVLAFLEGATARAWSGPVRIVAFARPDDGSRVRGAALDTGSALVLEPLAAEEVAAVAQDLLALPADEDVRPMVGEARTPSQVVDRLQALVQVGALAREGSRWVLGSVPADLPSDPAGLARWRVGRLPPAARLTFGALALLGDHATPALLRELVGPTADAGLAELHRCDLLDDGAVRIAPRHRDAVDRALEAGEGRRIAAEAARRLAHAAPSVRLALWERAGDRRRALEAALDGVSEARRGAGLPEAAAFLGRAVALCDDPEARTQYRLERARLLARSSRGDEALAELAALERLADPAAIALVRAWALPPAEAEPVVRSALAAGPTGAAASALHVVASDLARYAGRTAEAVAHLRRAAETAEGRARARVWPSLARMVLDTGDTEAAEQILREGLAVADDRLLAAALRRSLGVVLHWQGRVDEARAMLLESLATYRDTGQPLEEAQVLNALGSVCAKEAPEQALAYYRRAIALLERVGYTDLAATALANLGAVLLDLGRHGDADRAFVDAIARVRRPPGNPQRVAVLLTQHADALRRGGRPADAIRAADEAIAILGVDRLPLWMPYALAQRGLAELAAGRTAARWLEEAERLAGTDPALVADVAPLAEAQAAFDRDAT